MVSQSVCTESIAKASSSRVSLTFGVPIWKGDGSKLELLINIWPKKRKQRWWKRGSLRICDVWIDLVPLLQECPYTEILTRQFMNKYEIQFLHHRHGTKSTWNLPALRTSSMPGISCLVCATACATTDELPMDAVPAPSPTSPISPAFISPVFWFSTMSVFPFSVSWKTRTAGVHKIGLIRRHLYYYCW